MQDSDTSFQYWGVSALLTGLLALAALYLSRAIPAAFCALLLPLFLVTWRWGWRGTGVAALILTLLALPACFLPGIHLTESLLVLFLVMLLGALGSVFIENRQQREHNVTLLHQFGERAAVSLDTQAVWAVALTDIQQALGADGAAWVWARPQTAVAANGTLPLTEAQWQRLAADLDGGFSWPRRHPLLRELGLRDLLKLPLVVGTWNGCLVLARAHGHFSLAQRDLAQAMLELARQAALGQIRYALADQVLEHQLYEMETLQRLEHLVSQSLDLDETLQAILAALAQLLQYDVAEITYWDAENAVLVRGALAGTPEARAFISQGPSVYTVDDGMTGWLARSRKPLLLDDIQNFAEAQPMLDSTNFWLRSYLGIPLLTRDELVGTLELGCRQPRSFSGHDLELAQSLGSQAAVAIEKARLYRAMQQRVETLQQLSDVTQAAGHATDLPTLFGEIVNRVALIMDVDIAGILLHDAPRGVLVARAPFIGVPTDWLAHYTIPLAEHGESFRAWEQNDYWLVEDAQSDPLIEQLGLVPLVLATDMHQTVFVPLEAGGERIGMVQAANPRSGRRFAEADVKLLAMLTAQLSGMVRISQLLEYMEARAQHLASLVSVAAAMSSSLELGKVLETIAQAVAQVMGCQRSAIFEWDQVENVLNLVAAYGVSERYRAMSQGVPVTLGGRAHAVAANEIVLAEDVLAHSAVAEVAPLAGSEGFRAFVDLPLQRGEKPLGLLTVQFVEPHHFSSEELNLLRILAEQAAVAIENARLYCATDEELRRRVQSLEALQRITRQITSTLNLDDVLQMVMDEAIRFGGADAGLIILLGGHKPDLRVTRGYDATALAQLQEMAAHPQQSAALAQFIAQPETRYIPDLLELPNQDRDLPGARSVILAPVFYEEHLAGVIVLQSALPNAFNRVVLDFIEGLVTQTAIAVGNSRRYYDQLARGELMHQRAEQMRLLLEITRTMRSDRPLEDMLLDMAYATQEAIGYDVVLISVLEGKMVRRVAGAGIPLADFERMKRTRQPWARISPLLHERFRIGNCYYVPAEYQHLWRGGLDVFELAPDHTIEREPGKWHPHDILLAPLASGQGKILGYVSVDGPQDGMVPSRASLEVLELFVAQVALAVENNQLVESLRLQLNTLTLFNELSRSITTKLDLPLVLNTVVQSVTNLLDFDYATIFLLDRDSRRLIPEASSGYDVELLGNLTFASDEGLAGVVTVTGMPLVIEDTSTDVRYIPGPIAVGSSVMVPLSVEGRTVGVLTADRKAVGTFEPKEVATFSALADQVSVAVENARLFEEVKHLSEDLERRVERRTMELAAAMDSLRVERDRTELLYRIASELVASLDVDRVLHKAISLLLDAVQAQRGVILLVDSNTGHLYCRASIGNGETLPPGGVRSRFSRKEGLIGWVLRQQQAVLIDDVRLDERWTPTENDATRAMLAVPVPGASGEVIGAIFLHSDTAGAFEERDRRLVEAAAVQLGNALNNAELYRLIREQAERLGTMLRTQQIEAAKNQAILEGIADGVLVADSQNRVILFNAAAEKILGIPRLNALGRILDEMLGLYGASAQDWLQQVARWHESPDSYHSGDFLADRLEIEQRVVSVHLSPVISSSNEFLGTVSVFRDVTVEVEADRAKNEFVSMVSHELRTPMTSVKGYADLLLMGTAGGLNEMQTHFLQIIKSNADRLGTLVNDLLDLSRIETGKVVLDLKPIDVGQLIEQVVATVMPKAREKDIVVRSVVPAVLPKAYGDADRVTQILTNLAANAYKYTPSGGEVAIHAYIKDELYHVAVVDNGIGISKEDQQRIFDRFFRVDDPLVHEESGTGLGLAITVSLIRMQGGDIFVESESGEGSIFTFTLPLAPGEVSYPVGRAPEGYLVLPPITVLVVEDDPEVAQLLRYTLEYDGRRVLVANSGEAALHLAREVHPDLISLDIRLPDLDGFEVLQLLKRDPETADIPVVVVSVVMDPDRGLRLGAYDYLTKPVDEAQLLKVVDRILLGKGTILVVEDDKETVTMLREALRPHGFNVRTTGRGERVVRMAREINPALILLDLKLSGLDGYQVLEALKQDPQTADIPVIVMTGSYDPASEASKKVLTLGALRFLTKPFSVEDLAEEISRLVDGQNVARRE